MNTQRTVLTSPDRVVYSSCSAVVRRATCEGYVFFSLATLRYPSVHTSFIPYLTSMSTNNIYISNWDDLPTPCLWFASLCLRLFRTAHPHDHTLQRNEKKKGKACRQVVEGVVQSSRRLERPEMYLVPKREPAEDEGQKESLYVVSTHASHLINSSTVPQFIRTSCYIQINYGRSAIGPEGPILVSINSIFYYERALQW